VPVSSVVPRREWFAQPIAAQDVQVANVARSPADEIEFCTVYFLRELFRGFVAKKPPRLPDGWYLRNLFPLIS
jgi:hypothetical protein